MIRVAIVDDQELVRAGLRMIIAAEPDLEIAGEASSGEDAVVLANHQQLDVILMDVRMPGLGGIGATEAILASAQERRPRIVMLTTFDLDEYVYEAMRVGASGFLLKDLPGEDLVVAIRQAARGADALLAPSITRRLVARFAAQHAVTTDRQILAELTAREREILEVVARGLSNAEIARRLHISETTVKTHVAHLLMKLGIRDRVQAVVFAYESGLVPATTCAPNLSPDVGSGST